MSTRGAKRAVQRLMLERAADAWNPWRAEDAPQRYNDGMLVHSVLTCKGYIRTHGIPGQKSWSEHAVWATTCGIVLAVGQRRFTASKKSTTCIACIGEEVRRARRMRFEIPFVWDGTTPRIS